MIRLRRHLPAAREPLLAEVRAPRFLDRWGRHLDRCDDCHARFAENVAEDPGPDFVPALLARLAAERARERAAVVPLPVRPVRERAPARGRPVAALAATLLVALAVAWWSRRAPKPESTSRPAQWRTEIGMHEVRVVDATGALLAAVPLPDWPNLPRSATRPLRSLVDLDGDGVPELVLPLGSPRDARAELQVHSLRSTGPVLALRVELGRELRTADIIFGNEYSPILLETVELDGEPRTHEACVVTRHDAWWPTHVVCVGAGGVLVDYWHAGEVAAIAAWPGPRGTTTLALGGTSNEHGRASVTLLAVTSPPLVARSPTGPGGPYDLEIDAPPAGELLRMPQIEVGPDAVGRPIVRDIRPDPSARTLDVSLHYGSFGEQLQLDAHFLVDFARGRAVTATGDSVASLCKRYERLGRPVERCGEAVEQADWGDGRWLGLDDPGRLAELERRWMAAARAR